MKFARYLEDNVVDEWRRAYINYSGLKKLVKRVDARHKARKHRGVKTQNARGGVQHSVSFRRKQSKPADSDDDDEYASQDPALGRSLSGATNRRKIALLPPVTLDGTGLKLAWKEEPEPLSAIDSSATSSAFQQQASGSGQNSPRSKHGDIEAPPATAVDRPLRGSGQHGSGSESEGPVSSPHDDEDHEETELMRKGSGLKRKDSNGKARDLETIIDKEFDAEERKFFSALDNELDRFIKFYLSHERDMTRRYEMIARQLHELSEHRREYKARYPSSDKWKLGERLAQLVSIPEQVASGRRGSAQNIDTKHSGDTQRRSVGPSKSADMSITVEDLFNKRTDQKYMNTEDDPHDAGDRRRAEALARMLNIAGGTLSDAEDEQLRSDMRLAAMSHNPERYRAARKQLKAAVLEYYRGLEILKNYQVLNRTGFAKILKKFEKATGVAVADAYFRSKVTPSVLGATEVTEKLIKSTEETYTAYFEHGNRKRALERLRIYTGSTSGSEQYVSHYSSASRAGFYIGIAVCGFIAGLANALDSVQQEGIPRWEELLRVYGAEFLPVLFALLFGLNLVGWHHARVNTVFIFEWDVRHTLDYHEYFEMPAFFMMLLGICFWLSFLNPFPDSVAPTTWPLVWLLVFLVLILNPLPVFHYHSRRWLVTSLGRVLHGGVLSQVEFRDFFLGDELNSLAWPFSVIYVLGCQYNHRWSEPDVCDPNDTFWTAALLSVPALLRLTQCLRRYRDTGFTANLHIINAGKYSSTIVNYWLYLNWRISGSEQGGALAVWIVFAVIFTIYTASWDVLMDWSLLQRKGKYPLLRRSLVYEDVWPLYYWAIVSDVVLRFGWTIYLMGGPASGVSRSFIVALLEAFRRWQWNFLRLENEHIGNVDMYRISREVPLPYTVPKRKDGKTKADEDEEDDIDVEAEAGTRPSWRRHVSFPKRFNRKSPPVASPEAISPKKGSAKDPDGDASGTKATSRKHVIDLQFEMLGNKAARLLHPKSGKRQNTNESNEDFLARLRDVLVPDQGGLNATGSRLDDMGAAKGSKGRDYQPRKLEADADVDVSSSAGQSADEDVDEGEDAEAAEDSGDAGISREAEASSSRRAGKQRMGSVDDALDHAHTDLRVHKRSGKVPGRME